MFPHFIETWISWSKLELLSCGIESARQVLKRKFKIEKFFKNI